MIYILSIALAAILTYTLFLIKSFISNLFYNISLAQNPDIQEKLQNTTHPENTYNAVQLHIFWALIWSPLTLATIFQLILISITPLNLFITPEWIYTFIPFFIATTITPLITYNKPNWLNEWQSHNELASHLIQLEQITKQLNIVKIQLTNIQNKSQSVSNKELTELHNYAKFLIKISQILTHNINQLH